MKVRQILILFSAVLFACGPMYGTVYYSKSTGDLVTLGTWGTNSNGSGTSPGSFGGSGDEYIVCNRASTTIGGLGFWLLGSHTLTVGDGVSGTELILNNGESITSATLAVKNNGTLTINDPDPIGNGVIVGLFNNSSLVTPGSTIIYSQNSSNIIANVYGNLVIQDDAALTGSIVVLGTCSVAATKTLDLGANVVELWSSVSGGGLFSGTNATIVVQHSGSSDFGTFSFSGTNPALNTFSMNFSAGGYLTLGTDVQVTGTNGKYVHNGAGQVDLNGHTLRLSSDVEFSSSGAGGFRGSATSVLMIDGSGLYTSGRQLRFNSSFNTLKALSFNRAATTMTVGSSLNIIDSISVKNGTLRLGAGSSGTIVTLKASASQKARIGQVGGILSGVVRVETFIPGSSSGWANLGSPGVNGQTMASWDTYFSSSGANGIPMTCQSCSYGVTGAGGNYFESIQGWDEPNDSYDTTLTASTALSTGKGFWIYVGDQLTTTSDLLLVNTGTAVTGATTTPVTKSSANGYNLVANPYASPINWDRVYALGTNSNIVQNAIYIWNADLSSGLGNTTSYVGGVASPGGITSANRVIPSGQGFYVQAITAGSLAFDESVKTTSNTSANPLLRGSATSVEQDPSVGQVFRVGLSGENGDWDATVFRLHAMATEAFDGRWDAHKLMQSPGYVGYPGIYNKYTSISSKDKFGEDYSINSFPYPTKDLSIPLLVKVAVAGTYTISGLELENIPSCLYLKDKLTGKTVDLQMGNYVFQISDTTSAPRFELQLCRGINSVATAVSENGADANSVNIGRNNDMLLVSTSFASETNATIEAYNLLGQRIIAPVTVYGKQNTVNIPADTTHEIIIVKVSTVNSVYTKKVVMK